MPTEVFSLFYLMSPSLEESVARQQYVVVVCCKKGLSKRFLFSAFTKRLSVNSECEWTWQRQNKSCMCQISISSLKICNNCSFPESKKNPTVITKNPYVIMLHFLHLCSLIFTSQHRVDTVRWPGCTWSSAVQVTAAAKLDLAKTGSVQSFVGTEIWSWNSKHLMTRTVEAWVSWYVAEVPHLNGFSMTAVLLLTVKFSFQK